MLFFLEKYRLPSAAVAVAACLIGIADCAMLQRAGRSGLLSESSLVGNPDTRKTIHDTNTDFMIKEKPHSPRHEKPLLGTRTAFAVSRDRQELVEGPQGMDVDVDGPQKPRVLTGQSPESMDVDVSTTEQASADAVPPSPQETSSVMTVSPQEEPLPTSEVEPSSPSVVEPSSCSTRPSSPSVVEPSSRTPHKNVAPRRARRTASPRRGKEAVSHVVQAPQGPASGAHQPMEVVVEEQRHEDAVVEPLRADYSKLDAQLDVEHARCTTDYGAAHNRMRRRFPATFALRSGMSPLHQAACGGYTRQVEFLVDKCCYPADLCDECNIRPPLFLAAQFGHAQTVECLLQRGAHVDGFVAIRRCASKCSANSYVSGESPINGLWNPNDPGSYCATEDGRSCVAFGDGETTDAAMTPRTVSKATSASASCAGAYKQQVLADEEQHEHYRDLDEHPSAAVDAGGRHHLSSNASAKGSGRDGRAGSSGLNRVASEESRHGSPTSETKRKSRVRLASPGLLPRCERGDTEGNINDKELQDARTSSLTMMSNQDAASPSMNKDSAKQDASSPLYSGTAAGRSRLGSYTSVDTPPLAFAQHALEGNLTSMDLQNDSRVPARGADPTSASSNPAAAASSASGAALLVQQHPVAPQDALRVLQFETTVQLKSSPNRGKCKTKEKHQDFQDTWIPAQSKTKKEQNQCKTKEKHQEGTRLQQVSTNILVPTTPNINVETSSAASTPRRVVKKVDIKLPTTSETDMLTPRCSPRAGGAAQEPQHDSFSSPRPTRVELTVPPSPAVPPSPFGEAPPELDADLLGSSATNSSLPPEDDYFREYGLDVEDERGDVLSLCDRLGAQEEEFLCFGRRHFASTAAEDPEPETTALHAAARGGHGGCTRLLLDNKADPNVRDAQDKTPLVLVLERHFQRPGRPHRLKQATCRVENLNIPESLKQELHHELLQQHREQQQGSSSSQHPRHCDYREQVQREVHLRDEYRQESKKALLSLFNEEKAWTKELNRRYAFFCTQIVEVLKELLERGADFDTNLYEGDAQRMLEYALRYVRKDEESKIGTK
ncbi:unnamed protein product [Amoebophrya sp. A25]|nr:unnamed protein product [Amoebophrya sp. A25]|eukprot:GSA25T00000773001.1